MVKYEGMGKTIIFIRQDSGVNNTYDASKYQENFTIYGRSWRGSWVIDVKNDTTLVVSFVV